MSRSLEMMQAASRMWIGSERVYLATYTAGYTRKRRLPCRLDVLGCTARHAGFVTDDGSSRRGPLPLAQMQGLASEGCYQRLTTVAPP